MSGTIQRVYVGVPPQLVARVQWVERHRRTNPLSYIEGGSDVFVEYRDGRILGYDWIKRVRPYLWEIRDEIPEVITIFARRYIEHDYALGSFRTIWSANDNAEIWASLELYDQEAA